MGRRLQEQSAKIGHKVNRSHPTDDQCDDSDRKNGKGVLTRDGLGQTNRQETCRRNQSTRQHGHGGQFISKGGRANFVIALFHFANHHLNGNDGVIDQQTQRNDERTQRNFMQTNVEIVHGQKRHSQHQWNGDAHHQTRPHVQGPTAPQGVNARTLVQAQGQEADGQHNGNSLDQCLQKLIDRT